MSKNLSSLQVDVFHGVRRLNELLVETVEGSTEIRSGFIPLGYIYKNYISSRHRIAVELETVFRPGLSFHKDCRLDGNILFE